MKSKFSPSNVQQFHKAITQTHNNKSSSSHFIVKNNNGCCIQITQTQKCETRMANTICGLLFDINYTLGSRDTLTSGAQLEVCI